MPTKTAHKILKACKRLSMRSRHPQPPQITSADINNLPIELLLEIFAFCQTNDKQALMTLNRTCHWWRSILGSSPTTWQNIYLDDTKRPQSSLAIASYYVSQAAPLSFDVSIKVSSPDPILPLVSSFLTMTERWNTLTISGHREETFTFPRSLPLESLDHLVISIFSEADRKDDDPRVPKSTFAPLSPLWANRFVMHLWMTQLPPSSSLATLRFTHISITEDAENTHPNTASVLDFLSACPNLQEFVYNGWIHVDDHTTQTLPVVSLPSLTSLHLQNTCHTRAILSNIDTPKLTVLYLTHLNRDSVFTGTYNDDGDSDDEANDFSQSPFTDRATGMGLRKLLNRSNPPLKVLEMDFSDMRTKDFKVVFDKLVQLEEFLIVASDMSDNVMNLLRPYSTTSTSEGEPAQLQVRLPKLRSLELHSCPRITGQVVLDVLSSRVAFTDDNESFTSLSEVAVVSCEQCKPEQTAQLVEKLGERVRLE